MSLFKDHISNKLTSPNPAQDAKLRNTYPGMAHLAGEGPAGMTCRQCLNFEHKPFAYFSRSGKRGGQIKPAPCTKYRVLTGNVGAAVPADAIACRHFEYNVKPPARYG